MSDSSSGGDDKRRFRADFQDGRLYETWGTIHSRDGYLADWAAHRLREVLAVIDQCAMGRSGLALDIGVGSGELVAQLARRGCTAFGADFSLPILRDGRARWEKARTGAVGGWTLGDVEALPVKSDSLSLVTCLGVLEYLSSDRIALAELHRVVAPGGYVVLSVASYHRLGSLMALVRARLRRHWKGAGNRPGDQAVVERHVRLVKPLDLKREAKDAGFAVEIFRCFGARLAGRYVPVRIVVPGVIYIGDHCLLVLRKPRGPVVEGLKITQVGSAARKTMPNSILMVGNFPAGTGYAWNTIEEYFVALGGWSVERSGRAVICYPKVQAVPEKFSSRGIEVVEFDFLGSSLVEMFRFLRRYGIRILYLTDWPVFSLKYLVCRLAGVTRIVVHDRASGARDVPTGAKRLLKMLINFWPLVSVDVAIGISDFIQQRLERVSCLPRRRIVKIWNGIDVEKFAPGADDFVYDEFGIPKEKKIVLAYSRANHYKGIGVFIEAADHLVRGAKRDDVVFVFCGDGPDLAAFRRMVRDRGLSETFLLPGRVSAIDRILRGVTLVVVPSLWEEGFGLTVVEAMATGKVVIASRVGGIVDIIEDAVNGYLIGAGDSRALAERLSGLLDDGALRQAVGQRARRTVLDRFNIEDKKRELVQVVTRG